MSTYRIAIIGAGAIAGMHAKAIADLPQAKLVAACARNPERVSKFAQQYSCQPYQDYEVMLDQEKPDLVTICTPSGVHLEPTQAAAARGVHVLCEKPLEISTERVDQMIAAAQKGGVLLGGIFPQRYNPVVQAVRQAACQGRFGQLSAVNSYVPWWRDDAYYAPSRWQGKLRYDGGGALMNQSIHGVDAVQWIVAATMPELAPEANPVAEVFAYTAKRGHDPNLIEVEDTAVVCLKWRNGALGQLLGATSMYPGTLKRLQVAGRDGSAEILEDELITWQFRQEHDDDKATRERFRAKTSTGGGASDPMAISYVNHTRNLADFLSAISEHRQPAIDGVQARKAVAILEAVYQSAASGRPVAVR